MNGNDALKYGFKPCYFCGGTNLKLHKKRNCIGHGEYTVFVGIECLAEECTGLVMGTEDYAEREKEVLEATIRKWNNRAFRRLGTKYNE